MNIYETTGCSVPFIDSSTNPVRVDRAIAMISPPMASGIVVCCQRAMFNEAPESVNATFCEMRIDHFRYVGRREEVVEAVAVVRNEHGIAARRLKDSSNLIEVADEVRLMLDHVARQNEVESPGDDAEISDIGDVIDKRNVFGVRSDLFRSFLKCIGIENIKIFHTPPLQERVI